MHQYEATVLWQRGDGSFTDQRYSRRHVWRFDGGAEVAASPSPLLVPTPWSDPAAVDPEEALVAAAASCHMLFFLSGAAKRGYVVESYADHACGVMELNEQGRMSITRIMLRPSIVFSAGGFPEQQELEAMHRDAHERCYIANSLKAEILVQIPPSS